ncbi:MAG: hydroxysqualene dehydroxylase HpnE [Ignavibacteria bacterium]|nr:hydroxysqualene dehydroxylase HpnE [Ignavibacteria bacterium]
MKKCLIVGGGFAGLAAAVYLSKQNFLVELIEASPKLGGKAYSFFDSKRNSILDNGQHILMGCYKETLNFLNIINSENNLTFQKSLKVSYIDRKGISHQLKAAKYFYPINLLIAILKYSAVSIKERISIIKFCAKLIFINPTKMRDESVSEWLKSEGQNENVIKSFWEIIAVGALNCSSDDASSKIFAKILKQMFFTGNFSSTIIIPSTDLSKMYCENALKYITDFGGNILTSESANEIVIKSNKVVSVKTNKREIDDFDFILFAVPSHAIPKIKGLPESIIDIANKIKYSSILTFHIWVKDFKMKNPFIGLINSQVHWVFDHGEYITIVISHADSIINYDETTLFNIVKSELKKYINLTDANIIDYKKIKEKRATFVPSTEILLKRPSSNTEIANLFLAGDWINTGLPSTIEGAVVSAKIATDSIIQTIKS